MLFRSSSFADVDVPRRQWVVEGFIPDRTVTILGGDGGTGKSLLALQLAAAVATGNSWLDLKTTRGAAIFLSAEDEADEIHRRLYHICRHQDFQLSSLRDLHIIPLAGKEALLSKPDRSSGGVQPTALWAQLSQTIASIRPKLLILDTLADIYSGNEIDRAQVRAFIGLLRGLALQFDLAVLVLAHPSLSGMSSGSGSSGSTGWSNSVRSRLYFERSKDDVESNDGRLLSTKKANYAAIGAEMRLRWQAGVFQIDDGTVDRERAVAIKAGQAKVDDVFLELLHQFCSQGQALSSKPSTTFAPAIFEKHSAASGIRSKAFAASMERLLAAGQIHVMRSGPPSKPRFELRPGPPP